MLHAVEGILEATTLAEAGISVGTDMFVGTVYVCLTDKERLAQVDVSLQFGMFFYGFVWYTDWWTTEW